MNKDTQTDVNSTETSGQTRTPLTQPRSQPVLFEIISYRGEVFGPFTTIAEARAWAVDKWPHQEQDEERTGEGWDVQVVR